MHRKMSITPIPDLSHNRNDLVSAFMPTSTANLFCHCKHKGCYELDQALRCNYLCDIHSIQTHWHMSVFLQVKGCWLETRCRSNMVKFSGEATARGLSRT